MELPANYLESLTQRKGFRSQRDYWIARGAELIGVEFSFLLRRTFGIKTEWLKQFYEAAYANKVDGKEYVKYYWWLLKEARLKNK